jgi:KUP system potassium uptake protein
VRVPLNRVTTAGLIVALGIIYGDIGTSPLYVFNAIINNRLIDDNLIIGSLSCIIWTLTLQTTVKYVWLVLRADNRGEGGIFALYALVRRQRRWLVLPAMMGGASLLADGIITPPISITSAVEGLKELSYFSNIELCRLHRIGDPVHVLFFAAVWYGLYRQAFRAGNAGLVFYAGHPRHYSYFR